MKYKLIKDEDIVTKEKFGINISVYPVIDNSGIVLITSEKGHNEEFYNKVSTLIYIIIEGNGSFFLDDEEVKVEKGNMILIESNTRIYYKGNLKMVLITNPAWKQEDEVETKNPVW